MTIRVFNRAEVSQSQTPPNLPLRDYFQTLATGRYIQKEVAQADVERVEAIINRNNIIGDLLQKPEYTKLLEEEKEVKGDAKLGGVICIDGRFTTIHPFGRTMNVWEEPAAFAETRESRTGLKLRSAQFTEAIRAAAKDNRDLLEIVFAHTSLTTDHKCGAMKAGQAKHNFDNLPAELTTLEAKNLYLLENRQIPAITNTFNEFRKLNKLPPLKQVAIAATYDTDTMGMILDLGSNQEFSTTSKIRELKDEMQYIIAENHGVFGEMRTTFTDTKHFIGFSQRALEITKFLLSWPKFGGPAKDYIDSHYVDLTPDQKNALIFTLARTAAVQYITGLAEVPVSGPDHRFAEHEEGYMSISLDGKPMGRFDVGEQSFGSSPSKPATAIEHIHTKLSLLDSAHKDDVVRKPDILFVSKIIDAALWDEYNTAKGDQTTKRALGKHGQFFGELCEDPQIAERMQNGSLIIVPVLVDQDTGKVLSVIDHSIYLS